MACCVDELSWDFVVPIYAYKCSACGHTQDVLQKLSDPLLTVCPECGKSTYVKQLTAAGFQLKGSGWYVTDFRDNGKKATDGAGAGDSHHAHTGHNGASHDGVSQNGSASGDSKPAAAADTKAATSATPAPAKPAESSTGTSPSTK